MERVPDNDAIRTIVASLHDDEVATALRLHRELWDCPEVAGEPADLRQRLLDDCEQPVALVPDAALEIQNLERLVAAARREILTQAARQALITLSAEADVATQAITDPSGAGWLLAAACENRLAERRVLDGSSDPATAYRHKVGMLAEALGRCASERWWATAHDYGVHGRVVIIAEVGNGQFSYHLSAPNLAELLARLGRRQVPAANGRRWNRRPSRDHLAYLVQAYACGGPITLSAALAHLPRLPEPIE